MIGGEHIALNLTFFSLRRASKLGIDIFISGGILIAIDCVLILKSKSVREFAYVGRFPRRKKAVQGIGAIFNISLQLVCHIGCYEGASFKSKAACESQMHQRHNIYCQEYIYNTVKRCYEFTKWTRHEDEAYNKLDSSEDLDIVDLECGVVVIRRISDGRGARSRESSLVVSRSSPISTDLLERKHQYRRKAAQHCVGLTVISKTRV